MESWNGWTQTEGARNVFISADPVWDQQIHSKKMKESRKGERRRMAPSKPSCRIVVWGKNTVVTIFFPQTAIRQLEMRDCHSRGNDEGRGRDVNWYRSHDIVSLLFIALRHDDSAIESDVPCPDILVSQLYSIPLPCCGHLLVFFFLFFFLWRSVFLDISLELLFIVIYVFIGWWASRLHNVCLCVVESGVVEGHWQW